MAAYRALVDRIDANNAVLREDSEILRGLIRELESKVAILEDLSKCATELAVHANERLDVLELVNDRLETRVVRLESYLK